MLYLYLGIILFLLVLIVWNMMTEKNLMVRLTPLWSLCPLCCACCS